MVGSSAQAGAYSEEEFAAGLDQYMAEVDTNRDDVISRQEFVDEGARQNPGVDVSIIDELTGPLFNQMDADKNGEVSRVEAALFTVRNLDQACQGDACPPAGD